MNKIKKLIPLLFLVSIFFSACGGGSKNSYPSDTTIQKDIVGQKIIIGGKIESVESVKILETEEQPNNMLKIRATIAYTNSENEEEKSNFEVFYNNSDGQGWKLAGVYEKESVQ